MSDPSRLRPLGEHAALVRNRFAGLTGAELVDDPDRAKFVVITPEDLAELIEDDAATAAYHRTRDQEHVPIGVVDRLIARENRSGCGASIAATRCASSPSAPGSAFGCLSQIENGERTGTVGTLKKIAAALDVDLDDLI